MEGVFRALARFRLKSDQVEQAPPQLSSLGAQALLRNSRLRTMPALSFLCQEGQITDLCFVVTAGSFEIAKIIDGRSCTLDTSGPGSILALMPALDGAPCSVSMRALAEATVVEITRATLLDLVNAAKTSDTTVVHDLALAGIRRLRQSTEDLGRALYRALQSDRSGHISPLDFAKIQSATHAWQAP